MQIVFIYKMIKIIKNYRSCAGAAKIIKKKAKKRSE